MKVSSSTNAPWRDEQLLRKKYVDEKMPMTHIADEFGCHHKTIINWIERHGIEKRDNFGRYESEKPWADEDWMRENYVEKGLSQSDIANKTEVSLSTIRRWMERHGIEKRSQSEAVTRGNLDNPVPVRLHEGYRTWTHSFRGERDTVLVHRLLAVSEYGFEATNGKVVHHKNGVRWDNRPENIELLTNSEHTKHHWENGDHDHQMD